MPSAQKTLWMENDFRRLIEKRVGGVGLDAFGHCLIDARAGGDDANPDALTHLLHISLPALRAPALCPHNRAA
jgi:hypothetical protein